MRRHRMAGATMVEFSILLPILIVIIAFAIDGFVAAFRYSKMTYGVAELARRVTVSLGVEMGTGEDCPTLRGRAEVLGAALTGSGGPLELYFLQPPTYQVTAGTPYPFLTVIGNIDTGCVICSFIPPGALEVQATLAVERQSTGCI